MGLGSPRYLAPQGSADLAARRRRGQQPVPYLGAYGENLQPLRHGHYGEDTASRTTSGIRAADDPCRKPRHRRNRCGTTASTLDLAKDRDKSVSLIANVCTIQCMDDVSLGAVKRSPSKIPPQGRGRRPLPHSLQRLVVGTDPAIAASTHPRTRRGQQYDTVIDGLGSVRVFFESFAIDELDTTA
jgi:hypothetical protein